jgi:hypothetical protein
MSDLAAVAMGVGLGLLIVVPVFVAYRREMGANLRRALGTSSDVEGSRSVEPGARAGDGLTPEERSSSTLSGAVVAFGASAGVFTIVMGALLGNVIAIVSGAVLVLSVLSGFVVTRTSRD